MAFSIPEDEIVVASSDILDGGQPILYVSHDFDDESATGGLWQFHSGDKDFSMDKMRLVALKTILSIDPSVSETANLPIGFTAVRERIGLAWTFHQQE